MTSRTDTYKLMRTLIPEAVEYRTFTRPLVEVRGLHVRDDVEASREEFNGWSASEEEEEEDEFEIEEAAGRYDPQDGDQVRSRLGANGLVLWEGESAIVPGAPIVAIMTLGSENVKTGDVHQVWIMRQDMRPDEACRTGDDEAVCGDCEMRPGAEPDETSDIGKCYVQTGREVSSVFKAYKNESYPRYDADPEFYDALLKGGLIRWGAYGEAVLIPFEIVDHLSKLSHGVLGYTHAWRQSYAQPYQKYFMASLNKPEEVEEASSQGWRWFRVRRFDEPLLPGERICPASVEFELAKGMDVTCRDCMLCGGETREGKPSIATITHGAKGSKGFGIPLEQLPQAFRASRKFNPDVWDNSREQLQKLDDLLQGGLLQAPEQRGKFMRPGIEEPEFLVMGRVEKMRYRLVGARKKYKKIADEMETTKMAFIQAEVNNDDEASAKAEAAVNALSKKMERAERNVIAARERAESVEKELRDMIMQRPQQESLRVSQATVQRVLAGLP